MGIRNAIGIGVLYAGFLYICNKCSALQCELAMKNVECELYKAAYETYAEADKAKNKAKFLKKKDEE